MRSQIVVNRAGVKIVTAPPFLGAAAEGCAFFPVFGVSACKASLLGPVVLRIVAFFHFAC
jgi:hypothetical protein